MVIVLNGGCSLKTAEIMNREEAIDERAIVVTIDLVNVSEDRVFVQVDPGMFTSDTVVFRLPRIVQGTYEVSDFGSFTEGFVAYNYEDSVIHAERIDINSWKIPNTGGFDRLEYYVNDTFDIENTETPTPFSPSGTNIHPEVFVLNLHGFVGYFDSFLEVPYEINIQKNPDHQSASALPMVNFPMPEDSTAIADTYIADRYFEVTDNPMMYGNLDIERFTVGDIEIVLSVYSPNRVYSAEEIKETVATMMEAQKEYLGDMNSTPRYDIFLYLTPYGPEEPIGYGALEHHTSTVVVLPEWLDKTALDEAMTDVVSHEFFHILTPLTVHSEDVHYFDYHAPTFSKHLWMYEGVTEYFASHFQVYEGLQDRSAFYSKLEEKLNTSYTLDDSMSFTRMSEFVLEEPYASNYLNVYMKGALIGMCIDILMHEESDGQRSMLSLMKELSVKYGIEQPFTDDDLIDEITEMTYPSVGEFLQTHVVGTTPIDYKRFFNKVGLRLEDAVDTTGFFFVQSDLANAQEPFIDADPGTGELFFREMDLHSSLDSLGVEPGDIIKSINRQRYTIENINASPLIPLSFTWGPETRIEMVIQRGEEIIPVSGVVGVPTRNLKRLNEIPDPTESQITLLNYWLEK